MHALTGRGVHIATPNAYLAQRDCEWLSPAFRALGVQVGLLEDQASAEAKHAAYLCDVTYGTGYEFGFDYLRDQLARRQRVGRTLGQTLWSKIHGSDQADGRNPLQRHPYYAIIDEIDNVLLDEAGSPLVISAPTLDEAADADAHRLAHSTLPFLAQNPHFRLDASTGSLQLNDAGMERIHAPDVDIPVSVLVRTWAEYVELALCAQLLLRRDVDYVVVDGAVQIVDGSTGRIFSDRTWQDGLHQAVEAKEGVPITAERHALAQITRQRVLPPV